jgi:hypothetical protein
MSDKIDGLRTLPPDLSCVMTFPGVRPALSSREGDAAHAPRRQTCGPAHKQPPAAPTP